MIEKIIELEVADPTIFYGVNNSNIRLIKDLYPKVKIVARGTAIKIHGDEEEIARQKNLVPTDAGIEKGLSDLAGAMQCTVDEFRERYPMAAEEIKNSLSLELAIDYLYHSAEIRE